MNDSMVANASCDENMAVLVDSFVLVFASTCVMY